VGDCGGKRIVTAKSAVEPVAGQNRCYVAAGQLDAKKVTAERIAQAVTSCNAEMTLVVQIDQAGR
jgi:hypothetical protein